MGGGGGMVEEEMVGGCVGEECMKEGIVCLMVGLIVVMIYMCGM